MNHPILKAAMNVGLLHIHTMGGGNINVQRNSQRQEYSAVIRGNAIRERESFTEGTEAQESNTTIMTLTPYVSIRLGENLHQAAQGLPSLANALVGDRLNEPPDSKGCNQCGIITHTQGREAIFMWNGIHSDENMPLL